MNADLLVMPERSNIFWTKPCQVNGQSREYRKQEHVPCQFHLSLLERMGKQHFYLFTRQIADFHITLYFLIFGVLQRIGAQYLLVNCQEYRAAQPCQTVIGSRWAEVLPLSEINACGLLLPFCLVRQSGNARSH